MRTRRRFVRPTSLPLVLLAVLVPAIAAAQPCGDADGNGSVTVTDGVQVLRAAAGLASNCTLERCDVNASGSITVTDGVVVLRAAAGLSVTLECPGASQVEVRSLGTSPLTPGVPGPVLQVDVQGAASVTLMATTTDLVSSLFLNALQLPGGQVALTFLGPPPSVRSAFGAGQITLTLPNTPAIPYADGIYRFNVQSTQATTVAYQALINRRQNLTAGRLDLRIFIVDPASDTPPNPNDPALVAIGNAMSRKLAGAGIVLGSVTFGSVPTEIEQDTFVIDESIDQNGNGLADQVELLFAATPRDTSVRTLDLFLIQEFIGSATIGFAGGIPGPVMAPATRSSGIVVAAFSGLSGNPHDAEAVAHIAVHESAHYLGLFHTTENPDAVNAADPLADTAVCPADTFRTNVGACPDVRNLMFPLLLDATQQNDLTPDQGFVLQRHPLILD